MLLVVPVPVPVPVVVSVVPVVPADAKQQVMAVTRMMRSGVNMGCSCEDDDPKSSNHHVGFSYTGGDSASTVS